MGVRARVRVRVIRGGPQKVAVPMTEVERQEGRRIGGHGGRKVGR